MADWDTRNVDNVYGNDNVYSNDNVKSDLPHGRQSSDYVYSNDDVNSELSHDRRQSSDNVYGNDKVNSGPPHSRQSSDNVYGNDKVNSGPPHSRQSSDNVYGNDKVSTGPPHSRQSSDNVYGNDKVNSGPPHSKQSSDNVYGNDKVNSGPPHSRQSSDNVYGNDKVNSGPPHSRQSSYSSGLSSDYGMALTGGGNLSQESITDTMPAVFHNFANLDLNGISQPNPNRQATTTVTPRDVNSGSSGTAKAKAARSPYAQTTIDSIPKEEISIPNDANISAFNKDQIANFLRFFNIDDRIISHLHRKNVDGKRFARLKDSELENLNMKNPVILFFRDKSHVKNNKKSTTKAWVL